MVSGTKKDFYIYYSGRSFIRDLACSGESKVELGGLPWGSFCCVGRLDIIPSMSFLTRVPVKQLR